MSRSRPRNTVLLISGIAACALAFGPGTAAIAAPAAPAHADAGTSAAPPINYVALGDSYSAGYGLAQPTGLPVPGCAQSALNYPHQVAAALGLNLTDVTCSGAVTANITTTPQDTGPGPDGGTAPIQDTALSASTNIVTITIGGNDLGFSEISAACIAATANGPTWESYANPPAVDNCKSVFDPPGGPDSLAEKIADVVAPNVANTLAVIHQKAPNAKVFVLGYPAIAPDQSSGCFTGLTGDGGFTTNAFPFTNVDVPYLHSVEAKLDAAIQTATANAGDTFVPVFANTQANTPCAGNPNAYINGITLSATGPGVPFTFNRFTVYLKYGALHPNTAGVTFLTDQAKTAIEAALTAPAITSGPPTDAAGGAPYSFQVTASGFPAPTFTLASGSLPAGLTLDATTGAITGTPTAPGTSTFSITATNGVGHATSPEYRVTVRGTAPAITSAAPPAATVGTAYSFPVTASGFPAPTFNVTAGALPDGLSLNTSSGVISGTPTKAGSFAFTITADNSVKPAASAKYTVTVGAAAIPAAVVTKATLANTGSDVVPTGLLAGIVLLAGIGLLVVWRVAARR